LQNSYDEFVGIFVSTYTSYGIKCLYRITVGTERALDLSLLVHEVTRVDSDCVGWYSRGFKGVANDFL